MHFGNDDKLNTRKSSMGMRLFTVIDLLLLTLFRLFTVFARTHLSMLDRQAVTVMLNSQRQST